MFSKTYETGQCHVTFSGRERGVTAEEAPPRARSSWNGIVLVALCLFRAHPGDGAPPFARCYIMIDMLCFEHDLSWKTFVLLRWDGEAVVML